MVKESQKSSSLEQIFKWIFAGRCAVAAPFVQLAEEVCGNIAFWLLLCGICIPKIGQERIEWIFHGAAASTRWLPLDWVGIGWRRHRD